MKTKLQILSNVLSEHPGIDPLERNEPVRLLSDHSQVRVKYDEVQKERDVCAHGYAKKFSISRIVVEL